MSSWRILIPFCDKADAERALQVMVLAPYYYVLEEEQPASESPATLQGFISYEQMAENVINNWPAEHQARLYRLLYNAGIRINR